ncbi:hypothetical protein DH2020_026260 [Rehmannia glutinosa]|uniref:GRF-type domain-containing protein n=1 Tax=Rehmannia glutinosa TaxID=99300 RepID=A0ABR0VXE1_REHGL
MSHTTSSIDCYCGRRVVIRTTWTDENPGRRFLSCLHYDVGGCGYFDWEDPPMCRRSKVVIPGLLRKLNLVNGEVKKLEDEKKKLQQINKKLERSNKMLRRLVYAMPGFFFVLQLIWISFVAGKDEKEAGATPLMIA